MRTIEKRKEPAELAQWRAAHQPDPGGSGINFGYAALRQSPDVTAQLMDSLLAEQGGLCAYTGKRIHRDSAHVEHLVPQAHCERGQDVSYNNMAACSPQPNAPRGEYGAHVKEDWPSPTEASMFVTPVNKNCETRFAFNSRGEIEPSNRADEAAVKTIAKLRLDHKRLTALRGREIESVLGATRSLPLKAARKRLRGVEEAEKALNDGANVQLNPYCFALKQALRRFIEGKERNQKYTTAV